MLALSLSCGAPTLPRPPFAGHVTSDLVKVPYPPPPAKVEIVPPRPEDAGAPVWVDGEWTIRGKRWRWRRGRWIEPAPSARFASWTEVRGSDGQLYFAPGKWVDAQGREIPAPGPLVLAEPSGTLVVNEYGEEEDIGRDLADADGGAR